MPSTIRFVTPADPQPVARGFYQPDDSTLLVLMHFPKVQPRYFNHLENEQLRIETDVKGRLITLELSVPKEHWPVVAPSHSSPLYHHSTGNDNHELRFLDFRTRIPDLTIETNQSRDCVTMIFGAPLPTDRNISLGDNLKATIADRTLTSLTVHNLILDRGGRAIRRWRQELATLGT